MATTHVRRTPEEIVADLKARIAAVQARAVAKEARSKPESAAFVVAARALQKAQQAAKGGKNDAMDRALEAALATLSVHAVEAGLRMPQPGERKAGTQRRKAVGAQAATGFQCSRSSGKRRRLPFALTNLHCGQVFEIMRLAHLITRHSSITS